MAGHRGGQTEIESPSLSVRLLGPVAAVIDGREISITARRQRSVLACLAVHAGEPLSADRLLDEVWGDDLPDTRARAVAFQISKLRSVLEPARAGEDQVITTSPGGYALNIERDKVDVHQFDRFVDEARAALASDPDRCSDLIVQALQLWRGRPLADLGDEPFAERERHRLEQRHLLARRTHIEAALALGRHVEVIGDLETMVAEHPLEEAPVHMSMIALQRSGRTAEALRVYAEFRMRLGHELGIDPSLALQALESQLLAGGPDATGAPRPAERRARRIPVWPTPLVGRATELAGIVEALSSARLVTLCGFGGLGKTRLALEIANTEAVRFADGAWFVDLTSIDDGRLCVDTFLTSGGVMVDGREPLDRLVTHLADQELLVVVDNCEHVIDDVAELVTQIVRGAPGVRVLATSRIGLGVVGEAIWTIRPLEPASTVQMFVEQARLARPGFVVDESNRHEVERLGAFLDGIPLAIELAAARLSVMTVAQICEHLDDRFGLLARTGRNLDAKQRSLAAVMEWSYRLLDDAQQALLRRMSVCTGGFTLDAAMAIGVPDDDDSTVNDVLDGLGRLVEASLIDFDGRNEVPRYRMLDTVRHYAARQLETDRPGHAECSLAHANHYRRVATAVRERESQDHDGFLRLGDEEFGNLEAAIGWAYGNGHPRLGLAITRQLWFYYVSGRRYDTVMRNLRTGLELIDDVTPDVLEAAALALIAVNNSDDHDWDFNERIRAMIEEQLDIIVDPELLSTLLRGLAAYVGHTDVGRADSYLRAAADLHPVPAISTFWALHNRVGATWWSGRLDDPEATLLQIEAIVRSAPALALAAVHLPAIVAVRGGRWDDALRITEPSDHVSAYVKSHLRFAHIEALTALGRLDEAAALLREVERVPSRDDVHFAPYLRSSLELARGDPAAAVAALDERLADLRRDPRRLAIAAHLTSLLAVAAHELGQDETAAVLFGHSAGEQRRLDITLRASDRPRAERAIAECRTVLTDERFDQLAAVGAASEFTDLPAVDLASAVASPQNPEARSG
jgi:predicted ATPase/DNA-binding SARP family transcriptional activator